MSELLGVSVQPLDQGSALGNLTPSNATLGTAEFAQTAVYALAQASSAQAVSSLGAGIAGRARASRVSIFGAIDGRCSAAALVQGALTEDVGLDVQRNGAADCTVDVAIVGEAGQHVAHVAIDYRLEHRA